MSGAFARHLQRLWWSPRLSPLTALLTPLACLVGAEAARRRAAASGSGPASGPASASVSTPGGRRADALPVPVIVVGNVIVGGAGKTPTVIALVALLRRWGWNPGIVSRGHGRADEAPRVLAAGGPTSTADELARQFGDEPVLMHRRTGAPVAVARARRDAAVRLLLQHPDVDILVADDGLQHHALPRDLELVVFDGRGIGNGWPLPAGPLREWPRTLWPQGVEAGGAKPARLVLVNGRWPALPALPLPAPAESCWEAVRVLGGAVPLPDWQRGAPASAAALDALRGRTILAAAGIGDPERFFTMLEERGLRITRLPLPDHADFDPLPWPVDTPEVVVTEKDAVKLAGRALGRTRVWVVTLDFELPQGLVQTLRAVLNDVAPGRPEPRSKTSAENPP